jgi:hypothetical protein
LRLLHRKGSAEEEWLGQAVTHLFRGLPSVDSPGGQAVGRTPTHEVAAEVGLVFEISAQKPVVVPNLVLSVVQANVA